MSNPILILLPSRARAANLSRAFDYLMGGGNGLADILVLGGDSDGVIPIFNSVPHTLLDRYEIIGLMADDIRMFTPCWDAFVLQKLAGKSGLLYGRDGHQNEKLATHPFVTTNIFRALGFIYPAVLHHYCGDNFLMELLSPLGKVMFCPDLHTEHLHPDAGKGVNDETYDRCRKWWNADLSAWEKYRQVSLPIDRQRVAANCP